MAKQLESIAQIGARLRKNDRPIGEEALYEAVRANRFAVFRAGRYSYSTYDAVREWYDNEYAPPHPELIPTNTLTMEEAALALGCSTRTIQRRVASGKIPATVANGRKVLAVPSNGVESTAVAEPSAPKHDAMIAALTDNTEAIRALTRSVARLSGRHFMDAEAVAKLMETADRLNRAGELLGCVESATMRLVNVMNALRVPQGESQD
jgi:excisionase family DNA binding protein